MAAKPKYLFRSNSELARALGCHLTAASRLRSGRRRPSLDMAVKVVRTFNLDGAKAFEGIAAMQAGGDAQAAFFDKYVGGWTPVGAKA